MNLAEEMAADAAQSEGRVPQDGMSRLVSYGEELVDLKAEIDRLTESKKFAQARYDELRKEAIPEEMEAIGIKGSFTLSTGERLTASTKTFASVKAADREDFHDWLRAQGAADLIKEAVNPQTLSAFARERLENGEDLPPIVQVYTETTVSVTKKR